MRIQLSQAFRAMSGRHKDSFNVFTRAAGAAGNSARARARAGAGAGGVAGGAGGAGEYVE
jgi:hypothetical protein